MASGRQAGRVRSAGRTYVTKNIVRMTKGLPQLLIAAAALVIPFYFLRPLLRMVASGCAACFMNAEGLMPTMFLNCLEK